MSLRCKIAETYAPVQGWPAAAWSDGGCAWRVARAPTLPHHLRAAGTVASTLSTHAQRAGLWGWRAPAALREGKANGARGRQQLCSQVLH
eukprot:scaffold126135_cov18-Tisochrysis_lutea.AAC.1